MTDVETRALVAVLRVHECDTDLDRACRELWADDPQSWCYGCLMQAAADATEQAYVERDQLRTALTLQTAANCGRDLSTAELIEMHQADVQQLVENADRAEMLAEQARWRDIATAPKDGTAVLGYGLHTGSPSDAQRGVKAGDHWWAIMLWDVWRHLVPAGWGDQSLWVFAKDGKPAWSLPTHWQPLPAPPADPGEDR